jgi:hypothetical protein
LPHASRQIPDPGTYSHVLFRADWNPDPEYMESMYGEIAKSRCIQWPESIPFPAAIRGSTNRWLPTAQDRCTCMMFIRSAHLRSRMTKLGWVEVTDLWRAPTEKKVVLTPVVESKPLGPALSVPVPPAKRDLTGVNAKRQAAKR